MMGSRYLEKAFVFIFLLLSYSGNTYAEESQSIATMSYIVADGVSGKITLCKGAKIKRPPASTTKLMTGILVNELVCLEDVLTVGRNAVRIKPVRIGIKKGEQYTVWDLLRAALIRSANDACVALAEHVAGSEEDFVKMMNKKARDLGAHDTVFVNSHGLPGPGQHTTAYDMLLIINEFRRQARLVDVLTTKETEIRSLNGRVLPVVSKNRILRKNSFDFFIGKTGYTRAAGRCMVGEVWQDDSRVVFAVLGSRDLWSDTRSLIETGIR